MPRPISESLEFARQQAAKVGLHPKTIVRRLRAGWTPQESTGEQKRPRIKPGPKTCFSFAADYASRYHSRRREIARASRICLECNADSASEGNTKCAGCLKIGRHRRHNLKAA